VRTKRWISSSIAESQWSTELALYSSADYHVNNLVSPVLFQEALEHVPDNAIVVEIAPHSLLQAVLRRALPATCTMVGLTDKRQPNNFEHLFAMLGRHVPHVLIYSKIRNLSCRYVALTGKTCAGWRATFRLLEENVFHRSPTEAICVTKFALGADSTDVIICAKFYCNNYVHRFSFYIHLYLL